MHSRDALIDAFDRIREAVHDTVQDLDTQAMRWRPDPRANSIAWLVWHLTRVEDDHVSELAGQEQAWVADGWAERFGLPAGFADTGFGHAPDKVAAIDPGDPRLLAEYHDAVAERTRRYLEGLRAEDLDGVIDPSYDPPVTVGVRLVSVLSDALQHVGQAAYVRGLFERRT